MPKAEPTSTIKSLLYCAGINSFASLYGARSTDAENQRAADITSTVYNNMAACYLRQSKWEKAVYAASKTLALAPKNLKALCRRAEAYLELGRNQLAAKDIDVALDLRPEGALHSFDKPWSFLGSTDTPFSRLVYRCCHSQVGSPSGSSVPGRRDGATTRQRRTIIDMRLPSE